MDDLQINTIPGKLDWKNKPLEWRNPDEHSLVITAGPLTDLFISPAGDSARDNAPTALFMPDEGDFALSARVNVDFVSTYDAGSLQVRVTDTLWAKLCFEYSPQGQPMVVSVVTRGVSDDCNSQTIDGHEVYLRIVRKADTFAFHYSLDGRFWHFVRFFTLGRLGHLRLGFSAQSPTGKSCRVAFSEIAYQTTIPKDFRSGE